MLGFGARSLVGKCCSNSGVDRMLFKKDSRSWGKECFGCGMGIFGVPKDF